MWLDDESIVLAVVMNDEEQYSYWPRDRTPPEGWHQTGFEGSKSECDAYVERVWTDMRPKSVREWMDSASTDR